MKIFAVMLSYQDIYRTFLPGLETKEGAYVSLALCVSVRVCVYVFFAAIMQELISAARVLVSFTN